MAILAEEGVLPVFATVELEEETLMASVFCGRGRKKKKKRAGGAVARRE